MKEVLHLLQERNRYLVKFSTLNLSEIKNLKDGKYNNIDKFYSKRESILDLIQQIEYIINERSQNLEMDKVVPEEIKDKIKIFLATKDRLVRAILDQDLQIMSLIEKEKANVYQNLQDMQKGRKVVSAYKSGASKNLLKEKA